MWIMWMQYERAKNSLIEFLKTFDDGSWEDIASY